MSHRAAHGLVALVLLLLVGAGSLMATEPPMLSVGIRRGKNQVRIAGSRGFRIFDMISGKPLFARWNANPVTIRTTVDGLRLKGISDCAKIRIVPMEGSLLSVDLQAYRGSFVVQEDRMGKITVVNHVDLETYLRAVIKSEMLISAPPEALKAQAVVARTFALKNQNRYMSQFGFGLSADESSQVYGGVKEEDPRATLAVEGTRGLVLSHGKELVDCYYHSACGGWTQRCSAVWGGRDRPYLEPVHCPYCRHYPGFEWSYEISYTKLFAVLLENGYRIGAIRNVEESLDDCGRARLLTLHHQSGDTEVTPSQLRNMLGSREVRSTFFRLDPQAGEALCPEMTAGTLAQTEAQLTDIIASYLKTQDPNAKLRLRGTGSGHGVGLCQSGARRQASIGKSFREILSYYYQGITLTKAY